ncbi:Zinc finger protein, partial [Thalictrum thalictroides]
SITPQVRPRSLSPFAEFDDGNKRPAIMCRFFARGWCMKGSSCKFLHQKDSVASTSNCAMQGAPAACSEDNLKKDEGLGVENRRPFVLSEPLASLDVNGPSLKSNLPSESIRVGEYGESQRPHQFLNQNDMHSSPVAQGDLRYGSSGNAWPHKIAASGSQWKSFAGDENIRSSAMSDLMDYKRSTSKEFDRRYPSSFKNIVPEHRGLSSGSVPESGMYLNSSYSFALDNRIVEPPSMKLDSRSMPYGSHSSPGFFSSMNSTFNTSLSSTGISPFHQTFPWSGAAPPQRSFPLGPVQPDQACHTSGSSFLLTHSSSPCYSRPDQENFSLRGVPRDSLTSAGHERQSSINNWEPSVPFRPSFHLPSFMASYRSQYSPLHDSIDLPNVGDRAIQEPSVSQGATIPNIPKQLENRDFSYFRRPLYYSALCRDTSAHAIGALTDLAEGSGSFVAEQQNKSSLSKEEKSLIPGHIVNTSSAMEVDLDHSLNHQADNGKHNRESQTQNIFRAAIVEFVKELVKPHWREGHLSKDAHNTVVKKTVEKVLSTLQPNQIPNTAESTANYFKLFQPKLAKLVEAYVGKYAKSLQPV